MEKFYVLPNGNAVLPSRLWSVKAREKEEFNAHFILPNMVHISGNGYDDEIICESFEEACTIRDKIISDINSLVESKCECGK